MSVREDGLYLADRVRSLCEERPLGVEPWKGREIHSLLERALRHSGDQQRFYLAFFDGIRDLLDDEDEDAVLARFSRQASESERRVLADSGNRDHLTHVTQVFLLGWWILNVCPRFRTLPETWRPYGWSDRDERFRRLNRAWIHTSLLHDCAYSVEFAREARSHEVRVRAMFGAMIDPAPPSRLNLEAAKAQRERLWARRAQTIDRRISRAVQAVIAKIESRPDHGFVTGQSLMDEAARHSGETKEILEVAATSLLCHNFRHHLDPRRKPTAELVEWLSVDFSTEPLAALLTVTDEIQEWGRERRDVALVLERGTSEFVPEGVVLTGIQASDAAGLSIDARLLFRLFPEDREHRQRRATHRELSNAASTRQYQNAFKPRVACGELDLHLRITETVEDVPCRVARQYEWAPAGQRGIQRRGRETLASAIEPSVFSPVIAEAARHRTNFELSAGGAARISGGALGEQPLRVVVVGAGGSGKSTLLRALAREDKLGKQPLETIYVEELGDELTDLGNACEAIHTQKPESQVLLVVDHLDRIVGTPNEVYWLDQLEGLPPEPWLHVVGAARPEEYETVVGFQLTKFERAMLLTRVGPLMQGADSMGRATARAIEGQIRNATPTGLENLGRLAVSMQAQRFLDRPEPAWARDVLFGDVPAIAAKNGKLRFAHDVVQDYFSALGLARSLAKDPQGAHGAKLRALFELPRDVFRLLLDVIVNSRQLSREERQRAMEGIARELRVETTLWHWFSDMGRLVQAQFAVEALRSAQGDTLPEIGAMTEMLFGILRFTQHTPTSLEERGQNATARDRARDAVDGLAFAIRNVEASWPSDPEDGINAEVLTTYLADHLVTTLARAIICDSDPGFARELRELALSRIGSTEARRPEALSPAWARHHLERRLSEDAPLTTLRAMDAELMTRHEQALRMRGDSPFSMRAYQLAGHIGGTYTLMHLSSAELFGDALLWQERAFTRAMRIVRVMEKGPRTHVEQFGSVAHGRADAARHYSARVFLWALAAHKGFVPREEARYRLLDAAQAQEEVWRLARAALKPGERLANAAVLARAETALGRAAADADRLRGVDTGRARELLEAHKDDVLGEQRKWAEDDLRFKDESIYAFMEKRIGELDEVLAGLFARG